MKIKASLGSVSWLNARDVYKVRRGKSVILYMKGNRKRRIKQGKKK